METQHFDQAPEKELKKETKETVVDKMKRILGMATLAVAGAAAQAPAHAQEFNPHLDDTWQKTAGVSNSYEPFIETSGVSNNYEPAGHSYNNDTYPGWDEPTPQYGSDDSYKGFNPEDAPGTSSGEEKPEGDKQ
ncbi:MAG: hypothetical protein KBC50_00865 [Candidatus Pacebacteria bacterium]|nr:hypothetical protein [Candidatus Paceibacterota bacterium]